MEREELARLLRQVRRGSLGVAGALERLRDWPAEHLGFVSIDHHRGLRQGQAEVVFCQGKRPAQVVAIVKRPDFRERLLKDGIEPVANTPEAFAAQIKADLAKWAKVVQASGAKLE